MQTTQEYFNDIVHHLLKQNEQSEGSKHNLLGNPACAYRGKGGLKCAIGCKIPDELYDGLMEWGYDALSLVRKFPDLRSFLQPGEVQDNFGEYLNIRLQNIHDVYEPAHWPKLLQKLAVDFGLEYPEVSQS